MQADGIVAGEANQVNQQLVGLQAILVVDEGVLGQQQAGAQVEKHPGPVAHRRGCGWRGGHYRPQPRRVAVVNPGRIAVANREAQGAAGTLAVGISGSVLPLLGARRGAGHKLIGQQQLAARESGRRRRRHPKHRIQVHQRVIVRRFAGVVAADWRGINDGVAGGLVFHRDAQPLKVVTAAGGVGAGRERVAGLHSAVAGGKAGGADKIEPHGRFGFGTSRQQHG